MEGKVKRVFADKGYGWITGDDNIDYFMHTSEVQGTRLDHLQTGDRVEFTPGEGAKGPRANQVRRTE